MKTAMLIARFLLGIIFVVFGLNGFLHFLPQPQMPQAAVAFFGALANTGYLLPLIFASQVVGGGLLLFGMIPLGLLVLAPVIVNIVAIHLFLAPDGIPIALVVAALELFLAWTHRAAYRSLLASSGPAAGRAREEHAA